MGKYKFFTVVVFLFFAGFVSAQNKYAVHYKYKPQENFSFENPIEFLTEKSIQRRAQQGIQLDSLDLPVSEKYIAEITELTENILYHVNWLNASLVNASEEQVFQILKLDFVDKVVLVKPDLTNGRSAINKIKKVSDFDLNFFSPKNRTANNVYDFQNELLGIPEMHNLGFYGQEITIAVFDAGFPDVEIIPGFTDLIRENRIIGKKDFVDLGNTNVFSKNQHGTNVLSVLASNKPGELVAGAFGSNYILCITEDTGSEYRIEEYNWVKAASFSDSLGVDIINSSLGYLDFDDSNMDYSASDLDGQTATVTLGATIAANKGILVVTSAGNYGSLGQSSLTAPADAKGILAIGATTTVSERAVFSSQGPTSDGRIKPDLSTLGQGVYIYRRPNIEVSSANGTSFSAPQISALAAGLWQAKPELTKDELILLLKKSGTQSDEPDNLLGYGIPNFRRAYFGELLNVEDFQNEIFSWSIYPNPANGNILYAEFGPDLLAKISVYETNGSLIFEQNLERFSNKIAFELSVSQLKSGLYIVELQSGREIRRTKFIKR